MIRRYDDYDEQESDESDDDDDDDDDNNNGDGVERLRVAKSDMVTITFGTRRKKAQMGVFSCGDENGGYCGVFVP